MLMFYEKYYLATTFPNTNPKPYIAHALEFVLAELLQSKNKPFKFFNNYPLVISQVQTAVGVKEQVQFVPQISAQAPKYLTKYSLHFRRFIKDIKF